MISELPKSVKKVTVFEDFNENYLIYYSLVEGMIHIITLTGSVSRVFMSELHSPREVERRGLFFHLQPTSRRYICLYHVARDMGVAIGDVNVKGLGTSVGEFDTKGLGRSEHHS